MALTQMDKEMLVVIARARQQHDACTGAAVANAMKLSRSYVFQRLSILKAKNIVTWTAMPGSLRLVVAPTANTTELRNLPVNDAWPIIEHDTVLEPGSSPTPPATRPINKRDDATHNIGPAKDVPRKRGRPATHKASESPAKNANN